MAKTETNLDKLVINYLTETQFDEAKDAGTLDANQLYFTPITEDDRIGAYVPDNSSVMEIDRANKILDTKDYYTTGQIDLKLDEQKVLIDTKPDAAVVNNALSTKTDNVVFETSLTTTWATDATGLNQRVDIVGMKSSYNPIVSLDITDVTVIDSLREEYSKIWKVETYDGYIIVRVIEQTTIVLPLILKA